MSRSNTVRFHAARWVFLVTAGAVAVGLGGGGCASVPATTHMTQTDVDDIVADMKVKLQSAPFVTERNASSPPFVIVVRRVTNETRDFSFTEAEQWAIMNEVARGLNNTGVRQQYRIEFTLPAERIEQAKQSGIFRADSGSSRNPTHAMDARFITRTTQANLDRTDAYDCEFRLVELTTGTLVWADAYRFKRVMRGRQFE